MNIGIYINEELQGNMDEYISHLIVKALAKELPQHNFYIFTTGDNSLNKFEIPNIHNTEPILPPKFSFVKKWGRKRKIEQLIKKHEINLLLHTGNKYIESLKAPQVLILNHEDQLKSITSVPEVLGILVTNKGLAGLAKKQLAVPIESIDGLVHTHFKPADENSKQLIKDRDCGGKEFFLYNFIDKDSEALVFVLKAFSLFKQRQLSSWKLVILNRFNYNQELMNARIAQYKYRNDVVCINDCDTEKAAQLTASAYALINNSLYTLPFFEALYCGIPAILKHNQNNFLYNDAILFFEDNQPANLAEQLMRIYKDENLRTHYAQKLLELARGLHTAKDVTRTAQWLLHRKN